MSLIKCSECGKEISDKAVACPNCGCPLNSNNNDSNIKLIAAKCPSCGANIEVNENEVRTNCKFCNSTIMVDDAIKRMKIEITGEIEINNLPKLKELKEVADRYYLNGEYDDALEQYSTIVVLNPNDAEAALRKGICKSLTTNYARFEIKSALNGFKTAMKLENDERLRKTFLLEMTLTASKLESFLYSFFNNLRVVGSDEIYELLVRLSLCNEVYEELLQYCNDEKNVKILCYKGIVNNCTEILRDKYYGTGEYRKGKEIMRRYALQNDFYRETEYKRKQYLDLLNKLDSKTAKKLNRKNQSYKADNVLQIRKLVIIASLIIGIIYGIYNCSVPTLGYILIINAVVLIKPLFTLIYRSHVVIGSLVSIMVLCIFTVLIFENQFPTYSSDKFISVNDKDTVEFNKKNVKVCISNNCEDLTQKWEEKNDYYFITVNNYRYKYHNEIVGNGKWILFCQIDNNDNCIKYFKEKGKEESYILNKNEESNYNKELEKLNKYK